MDKTLLINIIWAVVCAIIGIVAQFIYAYLKAKGVATEEAAHQIAVAEEAFSTVEHAGKQKMELCIDALYGLIPAQVRIFFTREMIGQIVQKVFDEVEKYKNVWIESSAEKLAQKLEEEQLEANAAE
jgi:transcriptional regulator